MWCACMWTQFLVDRDVQRKGAWNLACNFIHLNTKLSSFVRTLRFSMNSMQGFEHEAPGAVV